MRGCRLAHNRLICKSALRSPRTTNPNLTWRLSDLHLHVLSETTLNTCGAARPDSALQDSIRPDSPDEWVSALLVAKVTSKRYLIQIVYLVLCVVFCIVIY